MKKTRMTKLVLNRETLHALENTSLQAVVGGVAATGNPTVPPTYDGSCASYPNTCPPCTAGTTGSQTCPPPVSNVCPPPTFAC
jgi:hypothetical protein